MIDFKERVWKLSSEKSPLILANDYQNKKNIQKKTIQNITTLNKYFCAIKLNFHLLLPLGQDQITKINKIAHENNLQTIADIKLNDIGNTNQVAAGALYEMGFDAIIVNPIMGPDALQSLVKFSHRHKKGVISLCHMSSPEAKYAYELSMGKKKLFQIFLDWASKANVDGIIVGATFPKIIQFCRKKTKLDIYSPGIGTQGGDIKKTLLAGSNYLIVGRTVINSKDSVKTAKLLYELTRHN